MEITGGKFMVKKELILKIAMLLTVIGGLQSVVYSQDENAGLKKAAIKKSVNGAVSPSSLAHIKPIYRGVVQKWLLQKTGWRPETIGDQLAGLTGESRQFMLMDIKGEGKNFHPFYAAADFNGDGHEDFAVVLMNPAKKKYAAAIFNYPFASGPAFYTEEIGAGDWLLWRAADSFGNRFIIGPPSSDAGYIVKPSRKDLCDGIRRRC